MDRLVIESTLSDVDDVFLISDTDRETNRASVVLSFKAANTDQIANAMINLRELCKNGVDLVICKTLQTGIYDIEIRSEALDEPIRLMNKVISNERLGELEDYILSGHVLSLTANVCDPKFEIDIKRASVKECIGKI